MTAKEYLQNIPRYNAIIDRKIAEITRLREIVTRITPVLKDDPTTGGGNDDKIGTAVSKIIDLQEEINSMIDYYVDMRSEAHDVLDKLKNPAHMQVLELKYFDNKSLGKIAQTMNYTHRGICYLHGRALQEYTQAMKKEAGK